MLNLIHLSSVALVARVFIALLGIAQLTLAIPIVGISGFAQISAALTFLSVGNILESALSWRLRFEVAQLGNTFDAIKLRNNTAIRNIKICVPLFVIVVIFYCSTGEYFIRSCLSVVILILINVIFLPWVRFLEGIGRQHINIVLQLTSAFLIFLFFFINLQDISIAKMIVISSSLGWLSSFCSFIYCLFLRIDRNIGAENDNGIVRPPITALQASIIVTASTLLFGMFPLLSHLLQTESMTAAIGVEIRILALALSIISVVSTQFQVNRASTSDRSFTSKNSRLFVAAISVVIAFLIIDWIAQRLILGTDINFVPLNSLPFGLLLGLVICQIPSSTISLVEDGGRFQMKTYLASAGLFTVIVAAISSFHVSLAWAACASFGICHVIPICIKYRDESM